MEPLTSLSCVELAAAIRERRTSCVAAMEAVLERAHAVQPQAQLLPAHRRRCGARGRAPCRPRHRARLRARPAARRADGAQGHVLPPRRGLDLRLEDPARRAGHGRPRRCSSTSTPPARSSSACSTWRSSPWGRPATTGTTAIAAIPGIRSASPAARRRARAPRWRRAPTSPRSAPTPAARSACPPRSAGWPGIRPTHGRVSVENILPLCPSLDTVGPLTRTVEDAALVLR